MARQLALKLTPRPLRRPALLGGVLADVLVVAALGGLGFILRLPLMSHGLWRDEGSTFAAIASPSIAGVLQTVQRTEFTPPLYYLFAHAWIALAGTGEFVMRIPSLACSLAAIALLYACGKRMDSPATGIVAATMMAASPLAVDAGIELRAYGLALALATFVLYAYVRAMRAHEREERLLWAAFFALGGIALVATYATGIIVVAALGATAAFAAVVRRDANARALLVAIGLIAILSLPIALQLVHDSTHFPGRTTPDPAGWRATLEDNIVPFVPFWTMHWQADTTIEIAVAVWLASIAIRRRFDARDEWIATTATIAVVGIAVSILRNLPLERHLLVYGPAVWLLFALLLAKFVAWLRVPKQHAIVRIAGGAAALWIAYVIAGALVGYPRAWSKEVTTPNSGAQAAAAALRARDDSRVVLVAIPESIGPSLWFYVRNDPRIVLRGIPNWRDPQYVTYNTKPWLRPDFTAYQVARIERFAAAAHATIALAVYPAARSFNGVPFPRALAVAAALERRHRVVFREHFAGLHEPIELLILSRARN